MKILITGGKSATALKLVKAFDTYQVVLADYDEVPSFISKAYSLISLGAKNEDTLAHTLLNKCLDEGIDLLLPIHHFEIEAITKSKILFNEFNIQILLPNREELDQYFNLENIYKANDWVVFMAGEIVFTTINEAISNDTNQKNLNGAFYLLKDDKTQFKLITI